ncbi:MAG: cytochrome c-type biogenesis protein CcmH [Chloroflexi bacterium]|nr:cytochrome c-type biogenesis protein CcmH [Chloroflexota bacterium]
MQPRRSPSPVKPLPRALSLLAVFAVLAGMAIAQNGVLHAQTPDPTPPDPTPKEAAFSESQAQTIDRMLMCPVCPAQTIAQSQVEIALQMRAIVREMLADGNDSGQILDFFRERYGKDILAAPPKSGANLVAWLLPVGGVLAALVAVFFIIRSMTRRGPVAATPQPVQDAGLMPYLELVDRHLEMTHGGSRPGGTSNQPGPGVESPGNDASDQTEPSGRADHSGAEESR